MTAEIRVRAAPAWLIGALVGVIAVVGLLGWGLTRDPQRLPSALAGRAAPDFTLSSLDGGKVGLSALIGKPVIINFWASWCAACRTEHELLVELGRRYADGSQLRMIGVNYRDTAAATQRFLAEKGAFPYPSGTDLSGRLGIDYGVYGLPETFFVDASGRVIGRHTGALTREAADTFLRRLGVAQ